MSRIAFFTERLPQITSLGEGDPIASFAFDLLKTLADQQHKLRVFSTYQEGQNLPPAHSRIEILRPFRNWGWLELPKMLPLLLDFQPDILHFVQPRAEALSGWTNAMTAIPGLAPVLGRPAIVTSYYDLHEAGLKSQRALLFASDVVTVSNRPQLELLEKFYASYKPLLKKRRPVTAVVPVPNVSSSSEANAVTDSDDFRREFVLKYSRCVFVPGGIDEQVNVNDLFETLAELLRTNPEAAVIFGGTWGRIPTRDRHRLIDLFGENGNRVLIAGGLDGPTFRFCLAHSRVTFLSLLAMTSLRLAQTLSDALANGAIVIITREQSLSVAVPWRDRENVFLVENGTATQQMRECLELAVRDEELMRAMRDNLPEFVRSESLDQPGNVMSRLYSETLARLRVR